MPSRACCDVGRQFGHGLQHLPYFKSTARARLNFQTAAAMAMSLCNIQFHRNAEHKTGEFADYAGNGNGEGYQPGPTLGACLSDATMNPHLRVEA